MSAEALSDEEYDHLERLLNQFGSEPANNLEKLDGFFVALICGPADVHISDILPEVWAGETTDDQTFSGSEHLADFINLATRHWNIITETLESGDVYLPLLLVDDEGITRANDWAQSFMRGMERRRRDWSELLDDEQNGGALVPILALAHENDPDPTLRPYKEPMDIERREQLIAGAAAGIVRIHRYFEQQRRMLADFQIGHSTYRRSGPKIGRNDPCPCGSGKKYKQCCGRTTLH